MPADVPGVIMILPYMEAGGTERHALHLVRGLLRDYRVGLLSPDGPMLDRFLELGVAHRAFPRLEQDPLGGLRAFRRGLPPRLVVVGDGSQRAELERRAGAPDLAGRVHFAGYREDAWRAPGGFDVMVMPSLQEAFPLACLEAMAAGRPVIASRVGGLPEMVEDGRTGLLVPPGDARAVAEALRRISPIRRPRAAWGQRPAPAFSTNSTWPAWWNAPR